MKMKFIGCGAADYDWSRYGEPGILGSTATLLNGTILLDCGPTVTAAMVRYGEKLETVKAVVNTHSHSDHFNVDELRKIAGNRRIPFFGSPQACSQVADFCEVHPLTYGDRFEVEGCSFLALPSNHSVEDFREETFNYLISADKVLLYALDTAWMLSKAKNLIGKTHVDAIVWDATMSEPADWRIFDHSDPEMFACMRRVWEKTGMIDENVKIWFDHRARTLWPQDAPSQEAVAARENVMLAHEGETVVF